MKEFKRIKDPIYGYIQIPVKYMTDIVDTAAFQRLRRILQTSYSPLYSSAVHNRFVHSMGVYYLGELAVKQFEYYGAAEPPVRCGVSHLSGLTEPPVYSYSA